MRTSAYVVATLGQHDPRNINILGSSRLFRVVIFGHISRPATASCVYA